MLILLIKPLPCHAEKGLVKLNYPFYLKKKSDFNLIWKICSYNLGTLSKLTIHPFRTVYMLSQKKISWNTYAKSHFCTGANSAHFHDCNSFEWDGSAATRWFSATVEISRHQIPMTSSFWRWLCSWGVIWEYVTHSPTHKGVEEKLYHLLHYTVPITMLSNITSKAIFPL